MLTFSSLDEAKKILGDLRNGAETICIDDPVTGKKWYLGASDAPSLIVTFPEGEVPKEILYSPILFDTVPVS